MANKRIMKKRAISKAAEAAQSLDIEQLLTEVSKLQEKNKMLVNQLEQLKQKDVQNQKIINKLRGRIKQNQSVIHIFADSSVQSKKTIKRLERIKTIKNRKITSTFGKPQSVKMTLAESLTLRKPMFVSQFITRILETFADVDMNKLNELRKRLLDLDYASVDAIISYCDLDKAYYESENYSFPNSYQTFDALYNDIMAYEFKENEALVDDDED